jgi:N-acetylglucosamine kinase-like BadF-type ATPase
MANGPVPEARLRELSPIVFRAAEAGDPIARSIVDRLADELVAMAGAGRPAPRQICGLRARRGHC